jgi:hypothetical protein
MFSFLCCCSKERKEGEGFIESQLSNLETKIKNVNRILIEFVTEEAKLGMREIPCIEMVEKVLLVSSKGEVPKKDIVHIYKSTQQIN